MKKLLTVFLSSVLLLGLIACGLSSPSEAPHIPDGSDPSGNVCVIRSARCFRSAFGRHKFGGFDRLR